MIEKELSPCGEFLKYVHTTAMSGMQKRDISPCCMRLPVYSAEDVADVCWKNEGVCGKSDQLQVPRYRQCRHDSGLFYQTPNFIPIGGNTAVFQLLPCRQKPWHCLEQYEKTRNFIRRDPRNQHCGRQSAVQLLSGSWYCGCMELYNMYIYS